MLVLLGASISGCATLSTPQAAAHPQDRSYAGRLAVRIEAMAAEPVRQATLRFELRGRPDSGQLQLDTPLGTALAQARWTAAHVSLQLPDRPLQTHSSLAALSHELLGAELPIAALFSWLNGEPLPSVLHERMGPNPEGHTGFEQLGWRVDTSRHTEGLITLVRHQPPRIDVRVRLDEPPLRGS